MTALTGIYKTLRTILLATLIVVGTIYVALYVLVSLPSVQQKIKGIAEREASAFLKSDVKVGRLAISPFSEVQLYDVSVFDQHGDSCIDIDKVAAGINLWRLVAKRRVVLTYAEIIGLNARISQPKEGAPLNIDFIIKAFAPKDKNKPPTRFDLAIHNIVIRQSRVRFDREWLPAAEPGRFCANHIDVRHLRADIALPLLRNDDFIVDLRRLSLEERSGLDIRTLSLKAHITNTQLSISDLRLELPGTHLYPSDIALSYSSLADIATALRTQKHLSLIHI